MGATQRACGAPSFSLPLFLPTSHGKRKVRCANESSHRGREGGGGAGAAVRRNNLKNSSNQLRLHLLLLITPCWGEGCMGKGVAGGRFSCGMCRGRIKNERAKGERTQSSYPEVRDHHRRAFQRVTGHIKNIGMGGGVRGLLFGSFQVREKGRCTPKKEREHADTAGRRPSFVCLL